MAAERKAGKPSIHPSLRIIPFSPETKRALTEHILPKVLPYLSSHPKDNEVKRFFRELKANAKPDLKPEDVEQYGKALDLLPTNVRNQSAEMQLPDIADARPTEGHWRMLHETLPLLPEYPRQKFIYAFLNVLNEKTRNERTIQRHLDALKDGVRELDEQAKKEKITDPFQIGLAYGYIIEKFKDAVPKKSSWL